MSNSQEDRQPTKDNLQKDALSIAQQIHDAWDGEVQCLVVLCPRDTGTQKFDIHIASTVNRFEKLEAIWQMVRTKIPSLVNLRGRD